MKSIATNKNPISPPQPPTEGLTEEAPGATGVSPSVGGANAQAVAPDPEVPEQKPRRSFTAGYKLRMLQAADACSQPGQIGELLRREGLYFSHLTTWRRQRDQGLLNALSPKKRGRKNIPANPLAPRVAQLEKQNQQLELKLRQAELIIEAQKKISEILGITQNLETTKRSAS
jgi:transposase-like protein